MHAVPSCCSKQENVSRLGAVCSNGASETRRGDSDEVCNREGAEETDLAVEEECCTCDRAAKVRKKRAIVRSDENVPFAQ